MSSDVPAFKVHVFFQVTLNFELEQMMLVADIPTQICSSYCYPLITLQGVIKILYTKSH